MRVAAILVGAVTVPVFLSGCGGSDSTTTTTTTTKNGPVNQTELEHALQKVLDEFVDKMNLTSAIGFGFKNADMKFGLSAGQYWKPGTDAYQPVKPDDKFLYGSGTKPFTATAIMSLVEQGKVSLDDKLEKYADPVLDNIEKGTTIQSLFGKNGSKVTVGHLLNMTSCINDFDYPDFDQKLLLPDEGAYAINTPLETAQVVANLSQLKDPKTCPSGICAPFVCEPGSAVVYSSTNYALAGLVLASFTKKQDWTTLNMWEHFPEALRKEEMPSAHFYSTEMINDPDYLALPGYSFGGWGGYPNTTIFNQSSTILGWTCGNLVAPAEENAAFFWDLLAPLVGGTSTILKDETVLSMNASMTLFSPVSWAAGSRAYGTGLMMVQVGKSEKASQAPTWGEWGTYIGHGGDTYGFLSEQGVHWGLDASLTVVTNHDYTDLSSVYCQLIKTAALVIKGVDTKMHCGHWSQSAEGEVALV